MFDKKPAREPLTREQSLDAVVITSGAIKTREDDRGIITLIVPFQASPFVERISRWFGATSGGSRPVELDEVGSFVWRMCDGKITVREMIQRLSDQYKINRKEAETSLTSFLRSLAGKGLVGIVVMKEAAGAVEQTMKSQAR